MNFVPRGPRVCLGLPATALTASWLNTDLVMTDQPIWQTDALHVGAPLYTAPARTFATFKKTSTRTVFLLGDPTLREHYVAPVAGFSANKSGSNVNLVWTNQPAATAGYRLYTATSTNTAQWNLLTNLAAGATSWTHTPGNPSANAYLLKTTALKTTGSGSYTNLSLGVAAPSEIIFP